ncbi:hypothetical protein IW262DRAFT_1464305 [Armillaria fumosa]|nr:hypothetical protein IW262DRAFT_1464305 [Armillaria fumosa]
MVSSSTPTSSVVYAYVGFTESYSNDDPRAMKGTCCVQVDLDDLSPGFITKKDLYPSVAGLEEGIQRVGSSELGLKQARGMHTRTPTHAARVLTLASAHSIPPPNASRRHRPRSHRPSFALHPRSPPSPSLPAGCRCAALPWYYGAVAQIAVQT